MPDPAPAPSSTSPDNGPSSAPIREWLVLGILASVQFTNIVDFMVIMPLGPELTAELKLTPELFSLIVSSYTFAAGIAGLLATMVIDRFSRRAAFLWLYAGFLLGTLACGLAPNYLALLAARFLTGAFGGILGGMAFTIVGDVFPEERRGAATGALISAFALASIFGVPIGITLGQRFGWHVPFLTLAALGVPTLLLARRGLPPLDAHLSRATEGSSWQKLSETFREPNHLRAFALTVAIQFGTFAVVPFISPFLVANVRMPKEQLPILYIVGGGMTLAAAPLAGRMADRFGKLRLYRLLAPITAVVMIVLTNLGQVSTLVAVIVMAAFMVSNAGRMVPAMAMMTSSAARHRRGGFLGANTAVQHIAAGLGTWGAGRILTQTATGEYQHFPVVGWIGAGVTVASLWIAGRLRVADDPAELPAEIPLEESFAAAAQVTVEQAEPIVGTR